MKRVEGTNVKVHVDSTGGFIGVDWDCPYCGGYNAGIYFSNNAEILGSDFEMDHKCEDCNKMVTIECRNADTLF